MPCLNEAETIERCIRKANRFLERTGIAGEIVVADNGSSDGSQAIATTNGARVVSISARGYGSALIGGIRAARGKYVIMADSDDSYDFSSLDAFVQKLREGYELVVGNRFLGGIKPGAMPPLHRYVGNPVLSGIGRFFFQSAAGDFHCGLRGFDRAAILALDLQASGMEFASEMVVKAAINKLRVAEVPTILWPAGRSRPPHLRSWRDGWRHLRFLLLFSPGWLFLYPGAVLLLAGLAGMVWLLPGPRKISSITFDVHTLYYCALAIVVGVQSIFFWCFAKIYGMREGIVPPDPLFTSIRQSATLELGLLFGALLFVAGIAIGVYALGAWRATEFGELLPTRTMRYVIVSGTAVLVGLQAIYSAFFMSVLEIRATRGSAHEGTRLDDLAA